MTNSAMDRGSIPAIRLRLAAAAVALAEVFAPSVVANQSLQAQTFSVLYTFQGGIHGQSPIGSLIRNRAGNLYGTTEYGGDLTDFCLGSGCGTVFRLDKTGKQTILHRFTGPPDGAFPSTGLIADRTGSGYGTTSQGGDNAFCYPVGCGTVFKLDKTGRETSLYTFTGTDGQFPVAGLINDPAGNLYGTTYFGGDLNCLSQYGCGLVFKVDQAGKETVLHRFAGSPDGAFPLSALVRDATGNGYGTTFSGGKTTLLCSDGCGTVFKLDKSGKETVVHRFTAAPDGFEPWADLLLDAAGNAYGTTYEGGDTTCDGFVGCGVVFKVDKAGKETIVHRFAGPPDGAYPRSGLIGDGAGNLYGTTYFGGDFDCSFAGCGTAFKVDNSGAVTVLYSFTGMADGAHPAAGLIRDASGNFYGTASDGGVVNAYCPTGCGVVFKLTP